MATPQQVVEQAQKANEMIEQARKPVEQTPPATEKPVQEKRPEEDYKERYSTYKASTDKTIHGLRNEVIRLTEEANNRKSRENDLLGRIEQLENALSNQPTNLGLSDEDLDIVDEETAAVVGKIVDQRVLPVKAELDATKAELIRTKAELDKEREYKRQELQREETLSFVERLKAMVPNVEQIDADPDFRKWLAGIDEDSGMPRLQIATHAKNARDIGRVASFYKQWLAENNGADPRESLISPTRAADAQPHRPVFTPNITLGELLQKKRNGEISEKEARRIEKEIFAAQAQRR